MNLGKLLKKLWKFALDNYFISIFLACIAFVILVSAYKLFFTKPTYVYVRVKMGQGLWWASTQKPSLWFIKNIKKGDVQTDLMGKPIAEILSVKYYPTYISNQYDVYLVMKLQVSGNKKTGKYNFARSTIGVGAPVDFEFPSSQFSGTIIDLSIQPIKDKYIDKIVYLSKPFAYSWEYEAIKIGDKFFDGEENVIEILDKSSGEEFSINSSYKGVIDQSFSQTRRDVMIKIKIKGKITDNKFVFGNDQIISPGKTVYLSTDNFSFTDYLVSKVE
ncbi:MAG: hypothetical protein AAB441_00125 [Patescibacteria group bacterium]